MRLVRPALDYLAGYAEALRRGWSPNTLSAAAAGEELAQIERDAAVFVASLDDRAARGAPITLPDGSQVPRLPGFRRWIWDDGFCGSIGLRWVPGSSELPDHVLGHIGYTVVPWRQRRGYGTRALGLMLDLARAEGLAHVYVTTDPDNIASQRVILANGGVALGSFLRTAHYGGGAALKFRIDLA